MEVYMSDYTTKNGVWNGWSWRYVGILVIGIAVLQLAVWYEFKYPIIQSLPLAVLIVSYLIIPRVKERRLGNAIAGVIATFIVGLVLEITVEHNLQTFMHKGQLMGFVELNVFPLLLGITVAFVNLRMTLWSEKKRDQLAEKRRLETAGKSASTLQQRVHRTKKKKRR
jgi:hypothetical protein